MLRCRDAGRVRHTKTWEARIRTSPRRHSGRPEPSDIPPHRTSAVSEMWRAEMLFSPARSEVQGGPTMAGNGQSLGPGLFGMSTAYGAKDRGAGPRHRGKLSFTEGIGMKGRSPPAAPLRGCWEWSGKVGAESAHSWMLLLELDFEEEGETAENVRGEVIGVPWGYTETASSWQALSVEPAS
ncbi:uncharacterized protein CLUP02_15285 [Colletotrichum lupini]|uniref:Uncharacterized protein n=1 Tax=Colletotrichum lupini TaxID=145971 RepID=A0A9Q8WNE2_9PEZI|nr:uncharacterized protein CLUP02_15285 [Colletotrichum lupini]UQC89754.1 hypothetical protein CLUP02_15285 [Colletotrichum lupini]